MWLSAKWEIIYSVNDWNVRKEKVTDSASIRLGTPRKSTNLLSLAVHRTPPVLPRCNYRTVLLQFHPVPVPDLAERNYKIFTNNKSLSWCSWRGISNMWNYKIYRFSKVATFLAVILCHCWSSRLCPTVRQTVRYTPDINSFLKKQSERDIDRQAERQRQRQRNHMLSVSSRINFICFSRRFVKVT